MPEETLAEEKHTARPGHYTGGCLRGIGSGLHVSVGEHGMPSACAA